MSGLVEAHLEIDGTDIHPSTVDPRLAADLIHSFFQLLSRAASAAGVPLHLKGITIEDKCFHAGFGTSEPHLTKKALETVSAWVSGEEEIDSKPDEEVVRHFNKLVRQFGKEATATIAVGRWEQQLKLVDPQLPLPPISTTTLRVHLTDIGVEPARARFTSGSEKNPFSLPVSVAQAEELRHHLNEDLDLVFTFRRNRYGDIDDGTVLHFYPMESNDDGEEWIRWLTENGKHWDEVKDPLEELGRRDD
ncbi:hypothetical protein [Pyxidicoccus trucidator]|uniref:hypothetical protein n=1 Tax=Pyxidicoccus trucidator TaxID=2709662 RepID=UPI0013D9D4AF|nr:hypothetical protein [Pyxidicoccus trucidator]